eukprot:TRINITY_DN5818_c0_g2_i2.p1 TRINITY_DN5818_c0_g2~~TRINITY_DN5818_c0_g2_i2.p1  ORF type:complete len:368 (+),score=60.07 TRINITY_DN5818_c0_g2_i2:115-1218(+)
MLRMRSSKVVRPQVRGQAASLFGTTTPKKSFRSKSRVNTSTSGSSVVDTLRGSKPGTSHTIVTPSGRPFWKPIGCNNPLTPLFPGVSLPTSVSVVKPKKRPITKEELREARLRAMARHQEQQKQQQLQRHTTKDVAQTELQNLLRAIHRSKPRSSTDTATNATSTIPEDPKEKAAFGYFTKLIGMNAAQGDMAEAHRLYTQMKSEGLPPSAATLTLLIEGALRAEDEQKIAHYLAEIKKHEIAALLPDLNRRSAPITGDRASLDPRVSIQIATTFPKVPDSDLTNSLRELPPSASLPALTKVQMDLEAGVADKTVKEYQELVEDLRSVGLGANLMRHRLIYQWFVPLRNAIEKEQEAVSSKTCKNRK